jgi:hypothetical protein
MRQTLRMFAVFWVLGCSLQVWAKDGINNPGVTVFVNDTANVPEQLVLAAEQNAARAFRYAGVDLKWINCGAGGRDSWHAPCGDPFTSVRLVVRLIPHARTLTNGIFGVSFLDHDEGVYADIFFEPIWHFHEQNREISLAPILGDVLAHELGHLLLGSNAHSRDGIMQPRWTKEQLHQVAMGRMRFNKEQAARMRARIAARRTSEFTNPRGR